MANLSAQQISVLHMPEMGGFELVSLLSKPEAGKVVHGAKQSAQASILASPYCDRY
jgi:hypothetical protein